MPGASRHGSVSASRTSITDHTEVEEREVVAQHSLDHRACDVQPLLPVGEDDDGTLGDLVEDVDSENPSDVAAFASLQDQLAMALEGLSERERQVLMMRFGLSDGRMRTLEEVGSHFNVKRERIRQLETKALAKLRHPDKSGKLEGFLESS